MQRRHLLAAGSAALALPAHALDFAPPRPPAAMRASPDRIIDIAVGIRPFRAQAADRQTMRYGEAVGCDAFFVGTGGDNVFWYFNTAAPAQKVVNGVKQDFIKVDSLTHAGGSLTFGRDGAIGRRLLAEFGPARAGKTNVRAFDVDGACEALGSVLVNDVSACAPASPGECLDRLALSHRGAVRLFK